MLVRREAESPYMDEAFHAPQALRFSRGDLAWDPKITTFPGLYFAGGGHASHTVVAGPPSPPCSLLPRHNKATLWSSAFGTSLGALRLLNCGFNAATSVLVFSMLARLHRGMSLRQRLLHTMLICLYPVHFFFAFLFYTDAGSTFFVLLTVFLSLPAAAGGRASQAQLRLCALAGAAAIIFRQTNVVWVAFTVATIVVRDLSARNALALYAPVSVGVGATPPHPQWGEDAGEVPFPLLVLRLVRLGWGAAPRLLLTLAPLILLLLAFFCFAVVNRGIGTWVRAVHTHKVRCVTSGWPHPSCDALRGQPAQPCLTSPSPVPPIQSWATATTTAPSSTLRSRCTCSPSAAHLCSARWRQRAQLRVRCAVSTAFPLRALPPPERLPLPRWRAPSTWARLTTRSC